MVGWVVVPALVALSLVGCPEPGPGPGPKPTDPTGLTTLSGLSATIPKVTRTSGSLEVHYRLEWTGEPTAKTDPNTFVVTATNVWLLDPNETVSLRFWDAAGSPTGTIDQQIDLSQGFAERDAKLSLTPILVNPPAKSRSVSIALGRSGLETSKVGLPPEIN